VKTKIKDIIKVGYRDIIGGLGESNKKSGFMFLDHKIGRYHIVRSNISLYSWFKEY
jgi:hypothetical protein